MISSFSAPEMSIGPARAAELVAEGADFIDVRETYERNAGYIPGTRHIELERLASQSETIDRPSRSSSSAASAPARRWPPRPSAGPATTRTRSTAGSSPGSTPGWPIEPDGGYVADH